MTLEPVGVVGDTALAARIATCLVHRLPVSRLIIHGLNTVDLTDMPKHARLDRAPNLFDLASECDLVILACETHAAARAALTGTVDRPGLLEALKPGSVLADFSPATPEQSTRLAGQLSAGAIGYVEAYLFGPIIYLGGYADHTDQVTAAFDGVLDAERVGPQGTARVLAVLVDAHRDARKQLDSEFATIALAYGLEGDAVARHSLHADLGGGEPIGPVLDLASAHALPAPILTLMKTLKSGV